MKSSPAAASPATGAPTWWRERLTSSLIFALGCGAGWLLWGRTEAERRPSVPKQLLHPERKIVLGKEAASPGVATGATQSAPGDSLERFSQPLLIVDPDARMSEWLAALKEMRPQDAAALQKGIAASAKQNQGFMSENEIFLRRWGEVDPKAAIAYAMTRPTPKAQGWVLKTMMEGWARKDHVSAAQWLNERPDTPDWDGVCACLLKGIASRDPWLASQTALASIPEGSQWLRDSTLAYLAGAMSRRGGVEEVKRWFASIPSATPHEQRFKEKAMLLTTEHLDHADPDAAKNWLEAQPADGLRANAAYAFVAKNLAKINRATALNWLASLPVGPSPVGGQAGAEIYQKWVQEKPEEVIQWARTITNEAFLREIGAMTKQPPARQERQ